MDYLAAISSVGFPIIACIGMARYMQKEQSKSESERLAREAELKKEITDARAEAKDEREKSKEERDRFLSALTTISDNMELFGGKMSRVEGILTEHFGGVIVAGSVQKVG